MPTSLVKSVDVIETIQQLDTMCILDTRLPSEIAKDHIPDFGKDIPYINLPWTMQVSEKHSWLDQALKSTAEFNNIFVICAYGIRSNYACKLLETKDLNLFHIYDGTEGCQDYGIPFKKFINI